MLDLTTHVEGLGDVERSLVKLYAQLTDLRWFWPTLVPLFVGWMRLQFESQGAFGGSPWAPLSPEYALWKSAHYPGKGILIAEGDLRHAASTPVRRVSPLLLELTIEDEKVEYHEEGTDNMPARPLLATLALQPLPNYEVAQVAAREATALLHRLGL